MWESNPLISIDERSIELRDSTPSTPTTSLTPLHDEEQLFRPETSGRGYSTPKSAFVLYTSILCRWLIGTMLFMIPSFLRRSSHDASSSPPKRNESQAALDGLRGLACLIVAFYHYFGFNFELNYGYWWDPEQPDGGWTASNWNLPIVKLIVAGPNMVALFFVISGYVLTHRFLSLIHQGKVESALMSMTSAIFRRFIRLYVPVFIVTFILQVLLQLGLFEHGRSRMDDKPYPPLGSTPIEQFWLFWAWWREACNPFTWNRHYPDQFDGNMWTIPIEYRCSMVLFLVAIGLARVRTNVRIFFIVVVQIWALNAVQWEIILFFFGMLLAQMDVLLAAKKGNAISLEKIDPSPKSYKGWLWYPMMFVATYLTSMPWRHTGSLGYAFLESLDIFPRDGIFSFWQVIGVTLMVICALYFRPFQVFLNTRPIQYLGHLSYALYLVHGSVIRLAVYSVKWDIFSVLKLRYQTEDEEGAVMLSVWLSFIFFYMPVVFILSDVFMRGIDQPTVVWGRQLWDYCTK